MVQHRRLKPCVWGESAGESSFLIYLTQGGGLVFVDCTVLGRNTLRSLSSSTAQIRTEFPKPPWTRHKPWNDNSSHASQKPCCILLRWKRCMIQSQSLEICSGLEECELMGLLLLQFSSPPVVSGVNLKNRFRYSWSIRALQHHQLPHPPVIFMQLLVLRMCQEN